MHLCILIVNKAGSLPCFLSIVQLRRYTCPIKLECATSDAFDNSANSDKAAQLAYIDNLH